MVDVTFWEESDRCNPSLSAGGRDAARGPRELPGPPGGQAMGRLLRTIEGEIIPRLLIALQSAPAAIASEGLGRSHAGIDDVTEFARLIATHDVSVASSYVSALLNRGVSLEKVYLELLAPAARLLGEWWKEDLRDFTEVTSGLCRMHQLLHEFSPAFLNDAQPLAPDRCVLLVPMPAEQHSFGLIMVAEFFRRAGWDVWDLHPSTPDDLLGVVRKQWFSVIGISLACETRIGELPALIAAVRAKSRNPGVGIMVGGQPFIGHPERVQQVGADCTAADGRGAAIEAGKLVGSLTHRV